MDDTFGKYSDYMAIGYAAMGVVLFAMIAWMYMRYMSLRNQEAEIAQLEAEVRAERQDNVAAAVGATEAQAQPAAATEGLSGMTAPDSERARTLPD